MIKKLVTFFMITVFLCCFVQAQQTERAWQSGTNLLGSKNTNANIMYPIKAGEDGCLWTNCYKNEVVLGEIVDADGNQLVETGYKFGFGTVGSATKEAVWDYSDTVDSYNYITDTYSSGTKLWISSDDTDDDAGGTGALTIEVYGLDSNYLAINETINLNGTTTVETTNTYIRVFRAFVKKSGSYGYNDGHIYIHRSAVTAGVPDDDTKVYAVISPDEGQTLMAVYTVPAGKTMLVTKFTVGAGNGKQVQTSAFVKLFGTNTWRNRLELVAYQQPRTLMFDYPIVIPEKSDVEIRSIVDSGTLEIDATWWFILVHSEE